MSVNFQLKTVYIPPGPYIFGPRPYRGVQVWMEWYVHTWTPPIYFPPGPYILLSNQQKRHFWYDFIHLLRHIICIIFIVIFMFPNAMFPIYKSMFPISNVCFQYTNYVSKRLFMFPISNFCFQYPMYVSNIHFLFPNANDVSKRQCFQCMFPIYIEPIWSMVTRPKFGSQIMNFKGHTGGKILDLPAYI